MSQGAQPDSQLLVGSHPVFHSGDRSTWRRLVEPDCLEAHLPPTACGNMVTTCCQQSLICAVISGSSVSLVRIVLKTQLSTLVTPISLANQPGNLTFSFLS